MSLTRRKFMKMVAGASATTMLPFEWLPGRKPLYAATVKRRHLINLVCSGGWDSSWMHNAFSEQDLHALPGAVVSTSRTGFDYTDFMKSNIKYTQKCSGADEQELATHPNGISRLGPLMRVVFEDLQTEMRDMLIWKGLAPAGGHTFGNNLLLQGNSSSYAISYSGLISQALSEVNRRPLHYTMIAGSPVDLFTNSALANGDKVPICIPSREQFEALTSANHYDLQDTKLRGILSQTVAGLADQGLRARLKNKADQVSAASYGASFQGADGIYGSQLLSDPEFKYLLKYYQLAIFRTLGRAAADQNLNAQGLVHEMGYASTYTKAFTRYGEIYSKMDPLPPFDLYVANPGAYSANVGQVDDVAFALKTADYYEGKFDPTIKIMSFNYALADFLVRRNLSAVVDVPGWYGLVDAHGGYLDEVCSLLITFSCYRALIKSLKAVPAGDGGNLFDATLIAMHTEFDREPWQTTRSFTNGDIHPGTNHGLSASVILAGYGIQRGKVVGDVYRGPKSNPGFNLNYTEPMSIDVVSGLTSVNGAVVSTLAVMPTIMAIFGVSIPFQQVTEWNAVSAIIDPRRS